MFQGSGQLDSGHTLMLHEMKCHARCRFGAHTGQYAQRLNERIKGVRRWFLHV
jgi:hypothetical protein